MDRAAMLGRIADEARNWDLLVVGGGATGLGIAVDAASRGYEVALVEQADFAHGTSSRSTKLVHGGVRYLQQGDVSLVLEALRERGRLRANAPHLVHDLPFVVPNYDWWEAPFYGTGLRLYDALAGRHGFGASSNLSRAETLERLPTIETKGLRGGVIYYDGQFDDARLAIDLAETAAELGGAVVNYVRVVAIDKTDGAVSGATVEDAETGTRHPVRARVVINATGAFTDGLRRLDDVDATPMVRASQGVHLVLPHEFLPGDSAIMVPRTDDGRVLFAIPWHGRVVVGTTDTPIPEVSLEPRPLPEEVDFLLDHAARYLTRDPGPADVLSIFAGIRPLVAAENSSTAELSRDHTLHVSASGLVTIAGGKWTTYRKMAEDAIDHAAALARLPERPCRTHDLRIHGYHVDAESFAELECYGSDAPSLRDLIRERPEYGERLHPGLRPLAGEVAWAVRNEMARSAEDFLARRTRSLLLDARASIEIAPRVAELMAEELGRDAAWQAEQVASYEALARGYLL